MPRRARCVPEGVLAGAAGPREYLAARGEMPNIQYSGPVAWQTESVKRAFSCLVVVVACAHGSAVTDRDRDGIPDSVDLCPDDPEDFDGYEDADGCPEADCDDCCSSIPYRTIGFYPGQSTIAERACSVLNHVADE